MSKAILLKALRERVDDTPYMVEETDNGFIIRFNIVDAKWYTILQKNGLKKTFEIIGKVNESKKRVNTTDVLRTIKWRAGGLKPTLAASAEMKRGELWETGFRQDLGVSESGKIGRTVNYRYNTSEIKTWLDEILADNGYKRALGLEAKIGIFFVVIAIGGGVIPVLVLLLTGNLG